MRGYVKQGYVKVGARSSPLSRVQVEEIYDELEKFHPDLEFDPVFLETSGDLDQETSLRDIPKNDFFTREIDALLLAKYIDVGIHSAKDLPEPLAPGLEMIALTRGLNSADSLVIPEGETIDSLPSGALIATSSERREDAVKQLRSDFIFRDIRGTIDKRLEELEYGRVDGVVIAEAALIRLELTHLNRVILPGQSTPLQGQLAVVAREGDEKMKKLFACIDSREI
jgi:hydroxymethylbilane synthase